MDPYVGEIRLFAGNYAPRDWAFCDGSQMYVTQNSILFTVIGNAFGGDGTTTFNLPDLRGMAPIHQGTGVGLTPRPFASGDGVANVTLSFDEMPVHNHNVNCSQTTSTETSPIGNVWGNVPKSAPFVYSVNPNATMKATALAAVGGGKPHNNVQPYTYVNYIIALQGVFPPKS